MEESRLPQAWLTITKRRSCFTNAESSWIVKDGQKVVDLGAQPGGWLQVTRETVGPQGLVLGIDLKDIQPVSLNVKLLKMDVYAEDVPDRIIVELGGPANAVLSDLAPGIIGAWDV